MEKRNDFMNLTEVKRKLDEIHQKCIENTNYVFDEEILDLVNSEISNEKLLCALKHWLYCHNIANTNAGLLIKASKLNANGYNLISDICGQRMNDLYEAGKIVDSFKNAQNVPSVLIDFWQAENNEACGDCMMSSAGPKHEECKQKMNNYWNKKSELIKFCQSL